MNCKKIMLPASLAAAVLLSSCTKIAEIPIPEEETTVSETTYSRIEIIEDTETSVTEEQKLSSEDFFAIFSGADVKSGKIADSMSEAVTNLSPDIPVKTLSKENIELAEADGKLSETLFEFTVPRCEGVLRSESSDGEMFAFSFSDEEDTEYAVILGSGESATVYRADKYISTCTETEYLAYCSVHDGNIILMPIAAGNSDCGIYGVVPIAKYMGYDMSETAEFDGIPDSVSLTFAGAESTEDGKRLYFHLENRFEEDVYYSFSGVFINGENVSDKVSEDFEPRLEEAGSVDFTENIEVKNGDALYFVGAVYKSENDELICEASLAVIAEGIEETEDGSEDETSE